MASILLHLLLNVWENITVAISLYLYYGVFALTICSIIFLITDIFIFSVTNNIFLTVTCFLVGFCHCDHSNEFISKCLKIYILSALFLGIYSVFTNLGGFIISEQYAFSVKNSSGVLLGTAIILCAFILNETSNKTSICIWSMAMLLLCACLLTFRCRTAIVSVFLALLYFLYRKHLIATLFHKPLALLSILLILVILNSLNLIPIGFIYDSLFSNKDVDSIDSITSGRLSTYERGMQIFSESPFLGNAALGKHLPPIDNFIVSNLTYYGIAGAILMFPPYIIAWITCVKGLFRSTASDLYPYLILFLICMTSFTEGPYPFGPGTPVVCAWFILGWWYKNNKITEAYI